MPNGDKNNPTETGLYEQSVHKITQLVKPDLHRRMEGFVEKSIEEHAKDNPRFAKMIEFEVRRRGDGPGLTQDVAEPLLWTGIKTAAALSIAVLGNSLNQGKFKMIGYASATGILLNNAVELFRLKPRYIAGLQGSLEMAKDRWHTIEETGHDPFSQQQVSEITPAIAKESFVEMVQKKSAIAPTSLIEHSQKSSDADLLAK